MQYHPICERSQVTFVSCYFEEEEELILFEISSFEKLTILVLLKFSRPKLILAT